LKCTISALDTLKYYQYNEVHYKYIQMHWKNIQILCCLLKYIYLPLKIHSYVLIYIHIPSKYITVPSKYIIVPSKNLTNFWHILQYHYYTPISFHIHWNCLETSLFSTYVMVPHYSTKMSCTCHNMFNGIRKWSIFREFHKSYCLIKYLNPKLISWDPINTCWTYMVYTSITKPSPT
jgi:hypothetical protein